MPDALSGLLPEELTEILAPLPGFRSGQISGWIAKGVKSFDEMANLPLSLRAELARRFTLRPQIKEKKVLKGKDGTVKIALQFADDSIAEAVLLTAPLKDAVTYTLCLSVQAGCPIGCVFCKTGSLGFRRNLAPAEIVEQFLQLREFLENQTVKPNIVIMGMGEPLLNLNHLRRAIDIFCSKKHFNYSPRRITVSTCGIAAGIKDLADNFPPVNLAVSLTTADEELRQKLMPLPKNNSLALLKESLLYFQKKGRGRITLEAVLLGGINTREKDALCMVKFSEGLDAVINLIPWNPVKGLKFQGKALCPPSINEVKSFTEKLKSQGLKVTCRFRRGKDISGACGQLGG